MSSTERGCRIALSQLPRVGPARLRWLLGGRSAQETFTGLAEGFLPDRAGRASVPPGVDLGLVERWRSAARALDPDALLAEHRRAGIEVLVPGDELWPFTHDPEPPIALYAWGDLSMLAAQQRVAIVGTRRCTDIGRGFAHELGFELAGAGVSVVSGLALGIDGAAHAGALRAARPGRGPLVAVVANGLDRISPRFHQRLAESVAEAGIVLSEAPLGTNGDRWRFPARNRLIAGLSSIVVVVESHVRGGALITVDEAIERGVTVMAAPGSVRSAASVGSNRLLGDGASPVCSAADVLVELGLDTSLSAIASTPAAQPGLFDDALVPGRSDISTPGVDPLQRKLLDELGPGPRSIDRLVVLTNDTLPAVMIAVQRLVGAGLAVQVGSTVSRSDRVDRTARAEQHGSGDPDRAHR